MHTLLNERAMRFFGEIFRMQNAAAKARSA
jgi:hypothetical protein